MTHTRSSVLAACLALLCSSYSVTTNAQNLTADGQILTTGNIVIPTNQGGPSSWVNGVYQDRLTCWGWGQPGYCGPNAIVRPGNNINFSFGMTDLYQVQAIANVLPDSGSGLRVNGYNFGFTAKNGNGWDDGRQDTLSAYVHFTNASGQVTEYKNYNLNYKFNWTTFNFSETFNTPYAAKDLGNVTYGFLGKDNNYWAGPYGPEVTNVNFSLKYSVDPCATNVLSSPTCPGYLQAISGYSAPTATATATSDSGVTQPTTTTSVSAPTSSSPTTNTTTVVETTTPPPSQSSGSTSSSPTTVVVATTTTSVTPSATNPQPKAGEVSIAGSQPTTAKSTVSTSQILSILSSEQSRVSKLEMSTASAAVEQAKQDAAKVTVEAQAIAATQQAQTLSASLSLVSSMGPQQTLGSGLQPFASQQGLSNTTQSGLFAVNQTTASNSLGINPSLLSLSPSSAFSFDVATQVRKQEQDALRQQSIESSNDSGKQLFNTTGPLNDYISPSVNITPPSQPPPTGSVVNRNVQPNDAAGGRDIATIATSPAGFDSYMQLALRDSPFYKPYEVYRNQVNVDNARALRQLSSDRLHQEMVNQQYKNNN